MYPNDLTPASPGRRQHSLKKTTGATYTPVAFADFLAAQIWQAYAARSPDELNSAATGLPQASNNQKILRILDPAVGDGQLLLSLLRQIPAPMRVNLHVQGFDTDAQALAVAEHRLRTEFPEISMQLEVKNFLDYALQSALKRRNASATQNEKPALCFDLLIANPPYVRTQTMGAQQAQLLASLFDLRGRLDLYYPFLLGISEVLAVDGIAGVICSNRFMTTKAGQDVRQQLLQRFHILHLWDMGDTKLFDAAVLPAVLLLGGKGQTAHAQNAPIPCTSIYASNDAANSQATDVFTALKLADKQIVALDDGRHFQIRHGRLENDGAQTGVWRLANAASDAWLASVQAHTWANFARIGKIRVGVKSTADKIFIRNDWDILETGVPELLRPLITRYCARRFKAQVPAKASQQKRILYPHAMQGKARTAVDLAHFPNARRYLEQHRAQLEARDYLIKAGRQWYELWVPQDPAAWQYPKLVFRDIASEPEFWLDTDGGIVNGECYWLRCEQVGEEDLLWLALAVANSNFIAAFYDKCFNNKLYAGRRRFMAQYVSQFPLPDPALPHSQQMIAIAKEIHANTPSALASQLAEQLELMVWQAFGLKIHSC